MGGNIKCFTHVVRQMFHSSYGYQTNKIYQFDKPLHQGKNISEMDKIFITKLLQDTGSRDNTTLKLT